MMQKGKYHHTLKKEKCERCEGIEWSDGRDYCDVMAFTVWKKATFDSYAEIGQTDQVIASAALTV